MLSLIAAVTVGVFAAPTPAGDFTDAGFSPDGGARGVVVDSSEASDGGSHAEERITARVNVRIVGARVLPPEVYLDMLRLPSWARPNPETAAEVLRQMLEYLGRTGFQLASVGAEVVDGEIVVHLNEGQLDRIVYLGQLSFEQVRFKLALTLPADVFNRPLLDRQVRELSEQMGLVGVRWELVRSGEVTHSGPQLEALPASFDLAMQGAQMVHARRPYELRIIFPSGGPGTGLGLIIRNSPNDGFETGLSNTWGSLLFSGDRLLVAGSGGFGVRSRLDTEKLYVNFSRAFVVTRYDTPVAFKRLRGNLWVENDWLARQRRDLWLENYWAVTLDAALQGELELSKGLHLLLGAGFEWRRLFAYTSQPGFVIPQAVLVYQDVDRKRPLIRLTGEWVVDPQIIRWDRRHVLQGEARQYLPVPGEPGLGWLDVQYQYVKEFGWHDLWVKSHGHLSWGDITFHDEISVGDFTRGVFPGQYVPSAANLSVEFRFSISRDAIKVSLFHDLALFAVPLRDLGYVVPQLANAFGPGLHILMQDMFQLDMYVAFGFRRQAQFGAAFSMQFQKAF